MKKVLFIDRDGTILTEPEDGQVASLENFRFIPGAISGLARIARETDYELVMVTNEEDFSPSHDKVLQILRDEGVEFAEVLEKTPARKNGTARLVKFLAQGVDLDNSFVIGDGIADVELAKNLGCGAVFFSKNNSDDTALSAASWDEICNFLGSRPRTATVHRKTKETDILVRLNIDGTGKRRINTGIGFFDHMLDQVARHGSFDLEINANGDRTDDGHHLTEDVAICLGEAFRKATGSRKGIERYSFVLPMDDCLAQAAVDIGGRPWLVWEVELKKPKTGEMPSEMFFHFFKSFSDNAKCSINIKAEGSNEHHKIESVFKAFARALKLAVKKTDNHDLPSTKGKL
ncbi:MAG: bifunctional imidazole glycerol-phosphate dehydratase/histidinol phosphatase [Bacteroidetes bacterium RBG_13_44_24]|nr:MAG: bifunctional imidazole glycerol-phosphate dehydratase/histidinol phosphatase [Bacteroidetes bacterium RBG_13_44_24]